MMKFATKFLMVGAIAAAAVAISMVPSEAAKKKMAASKTCGAAGALCATNCANGWCSNFTCGFDGKWYPAVLMPVCAQSFCINVKKKC